MTPTLDALASSPHGRLLENSYSQPICSPTRSQLLTGLYQIHTGLQHGVIWPAQPNGIPANTTTIADKLRQQGYATHAIGKWHVGFFTKGHTPLARGFDSFFGFWGGGEDYYTHVAQKGFDFRRNNDTFWAAQGNYSTTLFSQQAEHVIRQHAAKQQQQHEEEEDPQPLFLYLA